MCYVIWLCICRLRNPAWNAHAQYCHLWPARPYHTSPLYLINGTIFGKKVTEHKMCVLIVSINIVCNIFHAEENSAIYELKCVSIFMEGSRYSCQILMKLKFSRNILKKYSKYQVSWKSFRWEPSCYMRTDRRTDMTKLIVALRSFAKGPEKAQQKISYWETGMLFVF
jgi:hypothetical protein